MRFLSAPSVVDETLLVALTLAIGVSIALLFALWVTLTLARRRRAVMRMRALVDPVTGLGSRVQLVRDLRLLSRDRAAGGTYLLAMFTLPHLSSYELEYGVDAAEELLGRLGRKLANAVGRAGSAYSSERGGFVVLARVGRVSERVIVAAATAALYEEHPGLEVLTRASTVTAAAGATNPRDTLRWLEGLSEERPEVVREAETSRVRRAPLAARSRARALVGVHGPTRPHGTPGSTLLEREPPHRIARRTSHDLRTGGVRGPARHIEQAAGGGAEWVGEGAEQDGQGAEWTGGAGAEWAGEGAEWTGGEGAEQAEEGAEWTAGEGAPDAVAVARRRDAPRRNPPPRWMPYLRVSTRFKLSVLCGVAWMCLSAWLAWPWINELARSISLPAALMLIAGIALIPGYLNVQLVTSLLMDHPAPIDFDFTYPGLTLLIAAYNEECDIAQTLAYALDQDYSGALNVIVIDDGSTDETVAIAKGFARLDERVRVMEVAHGGKALALNAGLRATRTPLVATIDADTLLMPDALRRIVSRMLLSPADTVAVAGSVMVRNSRASWVTAAQTWDYFLGIGSIKRQQALLQATLVAQGAFSVYHARALRAAGGWPDCIGEDIVMTWALLDRGGRTTYEPSAVAFTEVPMTLRSLARQRRRWARGMIEGLRIYGRALLRQRLPYVHSVIADGLFPYLDLTFTLAFIPGIVLAVLGDYAIVGPATLAVLPLNALIAGIMYRRQRSSFAKTGLHVRQNVIGFFAYLLTYQLVMSPVSVAGYVEELFQTARRW
jgi:poly-beta-1,6-N-acetyl-D-glucosamine synthase